MTRHPEPNEEQIRYWSDDAGPRWVAMQERSDAMLAPFGKAAMEALQPREGERIVDVGAGCGDTTLELARRVGGSGRVLAVDVSGPMLHRAGDRAREAGLTNVDFLVADVQAGPPGGPHDAAFSRFGVMFFDDPPVAFRRLRESLTPGGRLAFCSWRSREENAWLSGPARIAARFVELPPAPDPHAPGPFGLFDGERTREILERAGWRDVGVVPYDTDLSLGDASTAEEAADFLVRLGPVGKAMAAADAATQASILDALREFLAPNAGPRGVLMPGAAWIVTAKA